MALVKHNSKTEFKQTKSIQYIVCTLQLLKEFYTLALVSGIYHTCFPDLPYLCI